MPTTAVGRILSQCGSITGRSSVPPKPGSNGLSTDCLRASLWGRFDSKPDCKIYTTALMDGLTVTPEQSECQGVSSSRRDSHVTHLSLNTKSQPSGMSLKGLCAPSDKLRINFQNFVQVPRWLASAATNSDPWRFGESLRPPLRTAGDRGRNGFALPRIPTDRSSPSVQSRLPDAVLDRRCYTAVGESAWRSSTTSVQSSGSSGLPWKS